MVDYRAIAEDNNPESVSSRFQSRKTFTECQANSLGFAKGHEEFLSQLHRPEDMSTYCRHACIQGFMPPGWTPRPWQVEVVAAGKMVAEWILS
jgi:hypothetical protein